MGGALERETAAAVLAGAVRRLAVAGVAEPRADAEVLLAHALGTDRAGLVATLHRPLAATASERFGTLVAARATRVPVFHLIGEREFWSLPIAVDARVLTPRPETELLVETAVELVSSGARVLDAGTGSGAVAAALARELPAARVYACDRDRAALEVALANLRRHAPAVRVICADWLSTFRARTFEVVVANPPYVAEAELATLAPEVRDHEPRAALAAGADGLAAIRRLLAEAPSVLTAGGWIVLEIGHGQADAVRRLVRAGGCYDRTVVRRDHAGMERVVAAQCTGEPEKRGVVWTR